MREISGPRNREGSWDRATTAPKGERLSGRRATARGPPEWRPAKQELPQTEWRPGLWAETRFAPVGSKETIHCPGETLRISETVRILQCKLMQCKVPGPFLVNPRVLLILDLNLVYLANRRRAVY